MNEPKSIYSIAGRVGGFSRAAQYDGREMTASAREAFTESFLAGHTCKVCPATTLPDELEPTERKRRAEALRKAHYARIAMASAQRRAAVRKTAPA